MHIFLRTTSELSSFDLQKLQSLLNLAFDGDFSDGDFQNALGGFHVLAKVGEEIIGHASVVSREIRFGNEPWREIGYVEAVAVHPDHQRRGVGSQLMRELHTVLDAKWPLSMLSSGEPDFYRRLGWLHFEGRSFVEQNGEMITDEEDQGLMLRSLELDLLDLVGTVTCRPRSGDSW